MWLDSLLFLLLFCEIDTKFLEKFKKKKMWCCLQKLNEGKGQSSLVFLENKKLCPILHTPYTQRQKYQQENLRVKVKFRYI